MSESVPYDDPTREDRGKKDVGITMGHGKTMILGDLSKDEYLYTEDMVPLELEEYR